MAGHVVDHPASDPEKVTRSGLFVPPSYHWTPPRPADMNTASVLFGITLGIAVFSAAKGARQSWGAWKRCRRVTPYVYMIWGHWLSNMGIAPLTNFYLRGYIDSSFWLWFVIVFLWCFQVQLLMQIIINRVALLIAVPSTIRLLKWSTFLIILVINISVFIIWIPAQLQISHTWYTINSIWDRIEKCIFLVIDASLNCLFIYLVRTRLIANGLTKYRALFRFNLAMIVVSVSLDIILVGLMSLPNHIVYLQFQCTAYIAKLHIEMNMANLIRKVVRASNRLNVFEPTDQNSGPGSGRDHSARAWGQGRRSRGSRLGSRQMSDPTIASLSSPVTTQCRSGAGSVKFLASITRGANHSAGDLSRSACMEYPIAAGCCDNTVDSEISSNHLEASLPPPCGVIQKTVRTEISTCPRGDEGRSRHLKRRRSVVSSSRTARDDR